RAKPRSADRAAIEVEVGERVHRRRRSIVRPVDTSAREVTGKLGAEHAVVRIDWARILEGDPATVASTFGWAAARAVAALRVPAWPGTAGGSLLDRFTLRRGNDSASG